MSAVKRGPYNPLTSLHRLEFILQHQSDLALRDSVGVGFGLVQIMQALHRSTSITQRSLAQKMYQTESNVSRQLQVLKRKGLVSISRNKKDKRQREVSLTSKGIKVYVKAERLLSEQYKELLKLMDKREIQTFDKVVGGLLSKLG